MANKNKNSFIKSGHQHVKDVLMASTCLHVPSQWNDRLNSPMQFNFQFKNEWNVKCILTLTDPHFPPNLNNILKISYQQNHNRMHKDLLFFKKKKSLGYEVFYKPNFFISRFLKPVMSKDLFFMVNLRRQAWKPWHRLI